MRLSKVVAYDPQTKEKQIFTFGTAIEGKGIVTSKGGRLNSYLEFCFREDADNTRDVEVEFLVDADEYSLDRIHGEDGTTRTILKKKVDGHWQVVARSKSVEYLQSILNVNLAELLKKDYVNNKSVDNFHGDLMLLDEIKLLASVDADVAKASQEARVMRENAIAKVRNYTVQMAAAEAQGTQISDEQIKATNDELADVNRRIAEITSSLGEARAAQSVELIRSGIARQLDATQQRYNLLLAHQDEIEQLRQRVKLRNDIDSLVPRVRQLNAIVTERNEYEQKRYQMTTDLEWTENELAAVKKQLDERELQTAQSADKRARLEAINNELSYIASLYEKNKTYGEMLLELNETQQRLESEKAMCANKLDTIEKSLTEVKEGLDGFRVPGKSVGELLETVRVDVKIDEVSAQVDKLQSEIAVKEGQIAERETTQLTLVKRFRSVEELDIAVSPLKAKDGIIKVLDGKRNKLEAINTSLDEKMRNLQRAMEDYKYRLLQLEASRSQLEAQLDKLLLRKQEEFKREVYLNSQKVYSDDATGVFAVSADFNDPEVMSLKAEIEARTLDRELLLERSYKLEGAIKEIKRHIDINNAEMVTLGRERDNINDAYNQIVQQNGNETVYNYLKAAASDNGTKYLLDLQRESVRGDTELVELKRYTESLRTKLASLKSRLKYLRDTQMQLDDTRASIDSIVVTNDRLKDELADMSGRLTGSYEQYKAVTRQIESIESKLEDVKGAIIETNRTIKVNEQQIAKATERAKKYAGSDDISKAIEEFRYEMGDLSSEVQMLTETKNNLEKDVFKKRLELEKVQWLYDSKVKEYSELYQELSFELRVKGLDVDKIAAVDVDADMEAVAKVVSVYDTTKANLADRIQSLYSVIKDQSANVVDETVVNGYEQRLAALRDRQAALENKRAEQTAQLAAQNAQRMRVTVAAAEARTLGNLKGNFTHSDIVALLIRDKIGALLSSAATYLNILTGGNYKLTQEDYKVNVVDGDKVTAYDELTPDVKTAVYISLLLAMPQADSADGRWLIFEERIALDKQVLADMLLNIDGISYVVDYTRERPLQRPAAQTTEQTAQ